jgi:hypothetical protein
MRECGPNTYGYGSATMVKTKKRCGVLLGEVGGGAGAPGPEGGERVLGGGLRAQAAPHRQQRLTLPQPQVRSLATCTQNPRIITSRVDEI